MDMLYGVRGCCCRAYIYGHGSVLIVSIILAVSANVVVVVVVVTAVVVVGGVVAVVTDGSVGILCSVVRLRLLR